MLRRAGRRLWGKTPARSTLASRWSSQPRFIGYDRIVFSHVEVAQAIQGRQADGGLGIRSAAQRFDLDFALQAARYDLVVPKPYLQSHPRYPACSRHS